MYIILQAQWKINTLRHNLLILLNVPIVCQMPEMQMGKQQMIFVLLVAFKILRFVILFTCYLF